MSRGASRLHQLERSAGKPRRARGKAQALTVMRLEGGAGVARGRAHAAALPMDIAAQIAVVRGRAVGKPSQGLLLLEERLLRPVETAPASPLIQRHDHGTAPAKNPSAPVAAAPRAARPRAQSIESPLPGSAFGGNFTVESFEDAPTARPAAIPAAAQGALSAAAGTQARRPWTTEQSPVADRARALSNENKAAAQDAAFDLAAAPGPAAAPEDTQWNDTLRRVASASPGAATPAAANPPGATPAAAQDPHALFTQMGMAMKYANSFDLGAVDLSARLDQFASELALAEAQARASAPVPVQALALDDFDLAADLAEISGAQSAAPSAAATPVNEAATESASAAPTPTSESRGSDHDEPPR